MARRATYVVDGRFFGHFFWKVEGSSAYTCESRAAHLWQLTCMVITIWWRGALTCGTCSSCVAINMHSNYYMVEGSPHVWLMCGMCSSCVAINVNGNYYMVEGSPHVWQLMCMIITIWWKGAFTCCSHVAINVHSNYYYMMEGSPHVCGN